MATAFPLIVISLSQGELSRDRAHMEQFSSSPIQTATVLTEKRAAEWKKNNKGGERDTQEHGLTDGLPT